MVERRCVLCLAKKSACIFKDLKEVWANIPLMEEILHHLICSLSHYLQGFMHPRWLAGSEPSTVERLGSSIYYVYAFLFQNLMVRLVNCETLLRLLWFEGDSGT